ETMTVGVLNGPGTLAVIATSVGRLLRISLVEGKPSAVAPVVPQTLYLNSSSGVTLLASGSLTRLSGSVTGTVDSLQGHILLDGLPLPILGVSGNAITAQVPWEVKPGAKAFQID